MHRTKMSVKSHKNQHKCIFCEKIFTQARLLKMHIDTIHNNEHVILRCEFCVKTFSHPKTLKKHIQNVHEKNNAIKLEMLPIVQGDEDVDYENQIQEHLIRGHEVFGNF